MSYTGKERNLVEEFLNFNRGELVFMAVSDYHIAKNRKIRHIRSGKICDRGEGAGTKVLAYGYDVLGNIVALCKDGYVRQFFK